MNNTISFGFDACIDLIRDMIVSELNYLKANFANDFERMYEWAVENEHSIGMEICLVARRFFTNYRS